ncbi:MAG: polysaccharide biosynthesis/export family protein, partial [Piscinibacter sp.]|uniref:polysaccharide biosynthesis/export family protein n=1 Tax=Piscinibacter sp. TaxID=1903157 RepID=UPI003D0FD024
MRLILSMLLIAAGAAQAQVDPLQVANETAGAAAGSPIRLRQAPPAAVPTGREPTGMAAAAERADQPRYAPEPPPYQPDDFERYVRKLAGIDESRVVAGLGGHQLDIRRFGAEVITAAQGMAAPDHGALVPADYIVSAGDELQITLWGSVDADVRTTVDRSGRISLPRVGSFMVAGTRYADLPDVISRRVGQVFKGFQLSVGLGQLRSVRVYVTGFAKRPGAHNVTSLSTIVNVLMRSGGPSAAGSYRKIELRRGGQTIATFDLYDLLLKGDKSADRIVQA